MFMTLTAIDLAALLAARLATHPTNGAVAIGPVQPSSELAGVLRELARAFPAALDK